MSKQWEKVLYPPFLDTISGEYYSVISDNELRCELYHLACRAIAAFKFPKTPLTYEVNYTIHEQDVHGEDIERPFTKEDEENGLEWDDAHPYFTNDSITYREIEIVIAWMKVYWVENQISNADNFLDLYTDPNIKTYSRANALGKYRDLLKTFKFEARELENRYSRVNEEGRPALGDINHE